MVGFGVPQILLPAPHQIGHQLASQAAVLWGDFRQTFLKAVLAGWIAGCGLGFLVAVAIDRIPFLQRGLLPLGNLVSAVPVVGIAPIMVMWFGFDWPSKAAVIVVMTFFPMLINTLAGFAEVDAISRDLMRSYGASYWQTFLKLRLPNALPFIFNALKINSTLAMIGAIVAEFFGSPIAGMGFRISVEVGPHERRRGLGDHRRGGAGGLAFLLADRPGGAQPDLLASLLSPAELKNDTHASNREKNDEKISRRGRGGRGTGRLEHGRQRRRTSWCCS